MIVLILIVASLILAGALRALRTAGTPDEVSADEITGQIVEKLALTNMTEVPRDQLTKHYSVNAEPGVLLQDYSYYINQSANNGTEVTCFVLESEELFPELEKIVSEHIASKAAGFKEMNPAEYEMIQRYTVEQDGRYVLVAVTENNAAAVKIFLSMLA